MSRSSSTSSREIHEKVDGESLSLLARVENFKPLSLDITPVEEYCTEMLPEHPVAHIQYSTDFRFIFGLYGALRSHLDYAFTSTSRVEGAAGAVPAVAVIRGIRTSAARWLLLLAFVLRQCTTNYTVWKERRDVLMSPSVLRQATREALPLFPAPQAIQTDVTSMNGGPAAEAAAAAAMHLMEERCRNLKLVSQRWLPATEDLFWKGQLSTWRAVRWELSATGCFARLYHKNFQVWHHRQELLLYALRYRSSSVSVGEKPPPMEEDVKEKSSGGAALEAEFENAEEKPLLSTLESEEVFRGVLQRCHGIRFEDIDERSIVRAVLCHVDGKNYHVWAHLAWFLHTFPFLLTPPSWSSLKAYACRVAVRLPAPHGMFVAREDWITANDAVPVPAALLTSLPPSPITDELQFTAELIHNDLQNNSAWCHRFALFREDLIRYVWRDYHSGKMATATTGVMADSSSGEAESWHKVTRALCAEELEYGLQWIHVDPTNEAAYTHTRSVALLYQILIIRHYIWLSAPHESDATQSLRHYLLECPLLTSAALTNLQQCDDADTGTVSHSAPLLRRLHECEREVPWTVYAESYSLLHYMQRALQTSIRHRAAQLVNGVEDALRKAVESRTPSPGSVPLPDALASLQPLYDRSSQFMLDNFHQVDAALYSLCYAKLEETWLFYFNREQQRRVRELRSSAAYRNGIASEWLGVTTAATSVHHPASTGESPRPEGTGREDEDAAVLDFLACEALALAKAKELTVADPIRLKYWRSEAMRVLTRSYGPSL